MAKIPNTFTADQIIGISTGLAFLFPKELEKIGVDLAWDVVINQNTITPIVKIINEMGQKINREFYEQSETQGSPMKIIKGKEDACREAEKALSEKSFVLDLKPFSLEKIKKVEGITVAQIFQLHPILNK